jgi:hypothetical protein
LGTVKFPHKRKERISMRSGGVQIWPETGSWWETVVLRRISEDLNHYWYCQANALACQTCVSPPIWPEQEVSGAG